MFNCKSLINESSWIRNNLEMNIIYFNYYSFYSVYFIHFRFIKSLFMMIKYNT